MNGNCNAARILWKLEKYYVLFSSFWLFLRQTNVLLLQDTELVLTIQCLSDSFFCVWSEEPCRWLKYLPTGIALNTVLDQHVRRHTGLPIADQYFFISVYGTIHCWNEIFFFDQNVQNPPHRSRDRPCMLSVNRTPLVTFCSYRFLCICASHWAGRSTLHVQVREITRH